MQVILDFILQYWKLIVIIIVSVVEFIFLLITKRRPVYSQAHVWQCIGFVLPEYIRQAEKKFDSSSGKLNYVINCICKIYPGYFKEPDNLIRLHNFIEDILNTPQKKGGN